MLGNVYPFEISVQLLGYLLAVVHRLPPEHDIRSRLSVSRDKGAKKQFLLIQILRNKISVYV